MTGTGSPGGTEQAAARLSDLLGFPDWVAMGAHYTARRGNVSPSRPLGPGETVDRGEVGLDVEQRRAVDAVDVAHGECRPLDADELHGGERDRVGPHRRAQREGATRVLQMRRRLLHQV